MGKTQTTETVQNTPYLLSSENKLMNMQPINIRRTKSNTNVFNGEGKSVHKCKSHSSLHDLSSLFKNSSSKDSKLAIGDYGALSGPDKKLLKSYLIMRRQITKHMLLQGNIKQTMLKWIEEEKKLLEEQLDGLKEVQKRNEELIESAQRQQSQMLAKKPTEEKTRHIMMILVVLVSIATC